MTLAKRNTGVFEVGVLEAFENYKTWCQRRGVEPQHSLQTFSQLTLATKRNTGVFEVGVLEAFEDYKTWCQRRGVEPQHSLQTFSQQFLDMYPKARKIRRKQGFVFVGVRLREPEDEV